MYNFQTQTPPDYLRIAWQSALASGLCLGLPAGLLFWLILIREIGRVPFLKDLVVIFQSQGLNSIFILLLCSLLWSFLLGKISGYRPWWKIALAVIAGILTGWLSPLSNIDSWFGDSLPVHFLHAMFMCGAIGSVTMCVGLACGLLLRNAKAALVLSVATAAVSVLAALLTIAFLDQLGIRVGAGNLAMSRVTAMTLFTASVAGGMVLGVSFSRFVAQEQIRHS
ncbi:MAG TPA: hypothetical protein VK900_17125 [Anaerolineales bacterium]|nr:hypothetical protein [Anaerolineales bacterium]